MPNSIKIYRRHNISLSNLNAAQIDELYQCDIITITGDDYHGVGATPELAADRATKFWINRMRRENGMQFNGPW